MTLAILEVSRKQDYIFSSRLLQDNVRRSLEIAYVTGAEGGGRFFREVAGDRFQEQNLISVGGGHTVLCFPDSETARAFVARVTEAAARRFRGMELYAKIREYDFGAALGANLEALSAALEAKKARRKASFGWQSVGVEKLDGERWEPIPSGTVEDAAIERARNEFERRLGVDNCKYPRKFEDIAKAVPQGRDNFLAVVHIDGNAMGKRVRNLYEKLKGQDFETARARLRTFSDGIQADFEEAFRRTAQALALHCGVSGNLPIRPVILAGDDVTFVCAGRYGLPCAKIFLDALASLHNAEDGEPYAACAGVAIVHKNYPFHRAYELAEELCGAAKHFGAEIDADSRVSVMDWHIEFGQLKDSLSELRKDYETEDGNRLQLRPVTVAALDGVDGKSWEHITGGVRTWDFFREMCGAIAGESGKMARGKIKNLREALKQGEIESQFYLLDKEINGLLYHGLTARYGDNAYKKAYEQLTGGGKLVKDAFRRIGDEEWKRCLFFDAIEVIDHCEFFEGVEA